MGWDEKAPQPISLCTYSDFSAYAFGQQIPRPFILIPDVVPKQTSISPIYLHHVSPMTPFILFPGEHGPIHRDVQIVTRSRRVAQPPIDRPFVGIIVRKDDEILRQLCTT